MKSMLYDEIIENLSKSSGNTKQVIDSSNKTIELINKLVAKRKELGLSQRALASKINMKQPALARIESLVVIPKISTLITIANALDLQIIIK